MSREGTIELDARTVRNERLRVWQKRLALPTILIPAAGLALAVMQLVQGQAGAMEFTLLGVMYLLTTAGVVVGFHRYLSHRSFKAGPGVRAVLAVLGSMGGEGPVINWVSNHRRHHRFSDEVGDPHSPYITDKGQPLGRLRGFLHAHVGWLFDGEITNAVVFSKDLLRDPVITRINQQYLFWLLAGIAIPGVIGGLWSGTWHGVFQGALWGGLARIALNQQAIWTIGSLGHIVGRRTFDTGPHEQSRNSMLFTLPILGDGWHNNHHAFPQAAVVAFEWWQIDPAGGIIRGLEKLGLARDVVGVPDRATQRRKLRAPPAPRGSESTDRKTFNDGGQSWKRQRS